MASGPSLNLNFTPSAVPARIIAPGYLLSRLISAYIGYLIVMGVLALIVPKFESVFSDFNVKLPLITVALLQASEFCTRCYLWAVCLPMPAMWAMTNVNIADKYCRRRLRLAAFILVVAFLIFTLIALLVPLSNLLQGGTKAVQQ